VSDYEGGARRSEKMKEKRLKFSKKPVKKERNSSSSELRVSYLINERSISKQKNYGKRDPA